MLRGTSEENTVGYPEQRRYRSGVGKLLYLMKWSRPDILNSVRDLSRFLSGARPAHLKAMYRVMEYCLCTAEKGLYLNPTRQWDGSKDFRFKLRGISDADYAKQVDDRKSVSGYSVFLEDAPIATKSKTQSNVTLSVAEAELMAAVECAQTMLFARQILESLQLQVELPMLLEIDCKGTVDLNNNWSVGGRTRHVPVKYMFLRDLKESGVFEIRWVPSEANCSDMFTKNLDGKTFLKHQTVFVK